MPYDFPTDAFRLVGKVNRAHGLRGELKVAPQSCTPEQFRQFSRVALVATDGRMTALLDVAGVRCHQRLVILKLATIDNRNEADLTAGMGVLLPADQMPDSGGRHAPSDLIGLSVRQVGESEIIGTVVDSFDNGAHQVLVIHHGDKEFLVPLVDDIVTGIEADGVVIDPPPGLLDLDATDSRDR
jgi:16S rRNA processing protein RimM